MAKRDPIWFPKSGNVADILSEQNPWWIGGKVPDAWARDVQRPLARDLWHRLQTNTPRRFQLILGPRRVGKTTSMYQTVRALLEHGVPRNKLWWMRLDHPRLMEQDLGSLVEVAQASSNAAPESPIYLFLDELTYAPKWDLWLKTFYDENWPVQLVGTSSATAAIRDRHLESGVGRWEEQYLAPYLFTESLALTGHQQPIRVSKHFSDTLGACIDSNIDTSGLSDLRRRFLLTGGFPELLLRPKGVPESDEESAMLQSQSTLRNDAVVRAIYQDIPQAFGVDNPMMLERVLYTLAGQVTGLLSPNTISKNLGLSQPTLDKYVAYLERAFLIFTLQNYSGSEASKQKRGKKIYFVDGAVRNAALQRGLAPLKDTVEMGLLLENLVAGHLHALSQQSQVRLYHWRDNDDEVDLIYDHPESPVAFEVASSASHHRGGLRSFMQRYSRFTGRCYLVAPNIVPIHPKNTADGIGTLPLDLLLLAAGAQAEAEFKARINP